MQAADMCHPQTATIRVLKVDAAQPEALSPAGTCHAQSQHLKVGAGADGIGAYSCNSAAEVTGPHVCDASVKPPPKPAGRACSVTGCSVGTLTHHFNAKAGVRSQPTCIVDENIDAIWAKLSSFRCCSLHRHRRG